MDQSSKEKENRQVTLLYRRADSRRTCVLYETDMYGFILDRADSTRRIYTAIGGRSDSSISSRLTETLTCDGDRVRITRRTVFRGICNSMRKYVWLSIIRRRKDCVELCMAEYCRLRDTYSGFEYQIHVDIQRTLRNHAQYRDEYGEGQRRLFNVLVAYANYNTQIGYCQGMASFMGIVLMYYGELDGFNVLVNVLAGMCTLFDSRLSMLPVLMRVQKEIFLHVIPEIYYLLKNEGVDLCMFVYAWYLTLFSRFDIKLVLRIWDVFVWHGLPVLLAVSAAVLLFYVKQLERMRGEQLVSFLCSLDSQAVSEEDVERIIRSVRDIMDEVDIDDINECVIR